MNPNLSGILSGTSISPNAGSNTANMNVMSSTPSLSSASSSVGYNSNTGFSSSQLTMSSSSASQLPLDSSPMIGVTTNVNVPSSAMPQQMPNSMPMASQNQPQTPLKDYNAAYLCRIGQETVQEIVGKTLELFQLLKQMSPPIGTNVSIQEDRKTKIRETLKTIELYFKRLRKMYERCNECCPGMEYIQIESLIPMKDDDSKGLDDKKFSSPQMKHLEKEHHELVTLLQLKNRQIKEVIDNLRSIVWEINTMLAMRKP